MCLPALAAPLMIASTVVSSAGAIMAGIGQSQQANYAAAVADQNRKQAEKQAQDADENTQIEAQRRYRMLAQTKGTQEASMAANGIDLSFGSALDVQRDTAMIGAEDIGQIYKSGIEKVKGFDTEAWNYGAEASAQRAKGKGALISGIMTGLGTALGGASQVAKMKAPVG